MYLNAVIQKFNLTPKESSVYLIALELGEAQIYEIAKKVRLPRTSCNDIIINLHKKGLLNFYKIRGKKIYSAANPEKFLFLLKEQEALLGAALPHLKALYKTNKNGIKPSIKFYDGVEGVKEILKDILNCQCHFLAVTSLDDAFEVLGHDFADFIESRERHRMRVDLLTKRTTLAENFKKKDVEELRRTRFLPDTYNLKTINFIYRDKFAIISLNHKLPTGLIIEDADIVGTYRMFFEIAWRASSS